MPACPSLGHSHRNTGGSALLLEQGKIPLVDDKIPLVDGQRGEHHNLSQSDVTLEKQILCHNSMLTREDVV